MEIKRVPLQRINQQPTFNVGDVIRSKENRYTLYVVDNIWYVQHVPYYHLSAVSVHQRVLSQSLVDQWQLATPEEIQERATIPIHVQKSARTTTRGK
jgi:hypothetical protein